MALLFSEGVDGTKNSPYMNMLLLLPLQEGHPSSQGVLSYLKIAIICTKFIRETEQSVI